MTITQNMRAAIVALKAHRPAEAAWKIDEALASPTFASFLHSRKAARAALRDIRNLPALPEHAPDEYRQRSAPIIAELTTHFAPIDDE